MKKLIFISIISALTFSACEKSETGGCIDVSAINYESWADYSDGSCLYQCDDPYAINYNVTSSDPGCEYQGDVVFYLSEDAAEFFTNGVSPSIDWLDIYIGNKNAGTMPGYIWFYENEVTCWDTPTAPIYFTYSWWNEIITDMSWKLRDGTGYVWAESTDLVLAGGCLELFIDIQGGNIIIKPHQDSH